MGDMGDLFKEMRERKKKHRWARHKSNMAVLLKALEKKQIDPFIAEGDRSIVLFRAKGKRKVTFWPTKDKWLDETTKRFYYGSAKDFIRWYQKNAVLEGGGDCDV